MIMGNKLCVFLAAMLICAQLQAQVVKKSLLSANSFYFGHTVYAFGYEQKKETLFFKCFSYSDSLKLKDSTEFNLGKHLAADYLEVNADTLHGVLNFYFQLADQKNLVTLLRFNNTLKTICSVNNYDANHINSLTAFGDETYIFRQDLYIIKTNTDTTGKQFYLSKYTVKAMDQPFEYDFKWQYAFERQYINNANIIYADSNCVMLSANVYDGLKKGQWILRINAKTGAIIKGTKLNSKGDNRLYLYSNALYNKASKSLDIIGSIYPNTMIDFKTQTVDFKGAASTHQLFILRIDSLGEVSSRTEKPLPMPVQAKSGASVLPLHFKVRTFVKNSDNSFNIAADIYEQTQPTIMTYYTSWLMMLIPNEETYIIKPAPVYVSSKAVPGLISTTKGDAYGKFYLNTVNDYDKFKYAPTPNSLIVKTGPDTLNNTFYVLRKINILNGKRSFNYVFLGKKGLENKMILNAEKGQNASLYFTGNQSYISFITNALNTEFELKLNKL